MAAKTREEWLDSMVRALRPKFKAAGYPLPKKLGVSCGWPSEGNMRKYPVVGECWVESASDAGRHEIFVSPAVADAVAVAAILVHELAHAALPAKVHHNGPFIAAHKALGLVGKPTTSTPGAALKDELAALIRSIGRYPHSRLKPGVRRTKKQTTRLLKAECDDCGYTIRLTAKWVEKGLPTCVCGGEFAAEQASGEPE